MSVDRPLLLSDPMVRAVLSGAKSVTRRVMVPQPFPTQIGWCWRSTLADSLEQLLELVAHSGPYGRPGDTLWVREAWTPLRDDVIAYRSDLSAFDHHHERAIADWHPVEQCLRWRPSIHLPRRHARLLLPVKSVRVERLQDITPDDAIAEGARCWVCGGPIDGTSENDCACFHSKGAALDSFQALWDSLNEQRGYGWIANPYVWRVEFDLSRIEVEKLLGPELAAKYREALEYGLFGRLPPTTIAAAVQRAEARSAKRKQERKRRRRD